MINDNDEYDDGKPEIKASEIQIFKWTSEPYPYVTSDQYILQFLVQISTTGL